MKILVPYKDTAGRSIDDPVVSGGIERFIRHLRDEIDGVHVLDVTAFYPNADPDALAETVAMAARGFDLIVSNYPNEGFNVRLAERTDIPIAWINISPVGLHPQWRQVAKNMTNFAARPRCSLWMISDHQLGGWSAYDEEIGKVTLGVIPPSFVQTGRSEIRVGTYEAATLGRCERAKDPFRLHRIGAMRGWTTVVMTNSQIKKRKNDYQAENFDWHPPQYTMWNATDEEVRAKLGEARCYLVTWPDESFGIAALEALSLGVPLVAISRDGAHACAALTDVSGAVTVVSENIDDIASAVESAQGLNLDHRREIAADAYRRWGMEVWRRAVTGLVEMATDGESQRCLTYFHASGRPSLRKQRREAPDLVRGSCQ